ncbi:alkaline phosphatase-like protein [Sporormia fimetaria CBS 119925]|uniref:alkaline phosphatase n=1 Tax=Sporormia fimetaria CBS 119925 TaxID=1340428 RepID=A0A6A6VD36_9PLEO|nr:alkaline phosphatase-like protein [Sporormia fimetaria CBS 119925]
MKVKLSYRLLFVLFTKWASAQTYRRLGGCPTLGCVFPPDQADFLAGQYFDIRVEVHAPKNGSEAIGLPPDKHFKFTIAKGTEEPKPVTEYFGLQEPELEAWGHSWYEDLFAEDEQKPSIADVTSKAYRRVALHEPGAEYTATLSYNNGSTTKATWLVRDLQDVRKTKNIILFIGDGMTTNMITAARLMAHKSINGKYQSTMQMDKFPVLGHQMTHSLDSFITDSANSASALYTGHKSSVNCLGVYADSSQDPFDDPKVETIAELFHRLTGGSVGIVSTAMISDATPGALTAHTRLRDEHPAVIDSFLNGITNYTWTEWSGPDVLFGGGAELFYSPALGGEGYQGKDYYEEFAKRGYQVLWNQTSLADANISEKALGIFTEGNMATWLDRNVYATNAQKFLSPSGDQTPALDQPGLENMTVKAIEILHQRSADKGFFLMSEAASIDKAMHKLDYNRALGELLELDQTIKASFEQLDELGIRKETLVLVTADHGHGFDVMGSVDTKYLAAQDTDRKKRSAIGTYEKSGLSQYTNTGNLTYVDANFPSNWDPRYALFQGLTGTPDHRENFRVNKEGRTPAVVVDGEAVVNPDDAKDGITRDGTLPVSEQQGVHSLTDVPVFAEGPCQELFGGVYNNVDIFFKMAGCLGLARGQDEGR